jgi:hypothetical protein
VRKLLTSVIALDGTRKRCSSSSSFESFRLRTRSDVFLPCGASLFSSGSSVPARRVLRSSEDLLPVISSGSSVPARRVRESSNDVFLPAPADSMEVSGASAYRGLGRVVDASIVSRRCSKLVGARGLMMAGLDGVESTRVLGRRWAGSGANLVTVGLVGGSISLSRGAGADWGGFVGPDSSARAMHNSVKLLQMLSAFRRSCRSVTLPTPPIVLAPLDIGPICPGAPTIVVKAKASVAAASMALKTSLLTIPFVLERADNRIGCDSRCDDVVLLASGWLAPGPEPRFGDADMVVAFVVAVGGRSSDALDMAAPEVEGAFPVSSRR